jgi:hypothetical protein
VGPFPPQIPNLARGHPPSAPHPAGTSPGRRAPPGGAKIIVDYSTKTEHRTQTPATRGPRPGEIRWLSAEHLFSPAAFGPTTNAIGFPAAFGPTTNATGFPTRISGPKGKCSTHQAVTKYFTNDTLSCSDSGNGANLLDLGVLSRGIPPRSACAHGWCPQLRPLSVQCCPGIEILQAGFLQVGCSSPVTRLALCF